VNNFVLLNRMKLSGYTIVKEENSSTFMILFFSFRAVGGVTVRMDRSMFRFINITAEQGIVLFNKPQAHLVESKRSIKLCQ